jgi:predicted pyridoxine 5'-phosphate oxidase superfamily flavin-nucleotide-binding protein
MAIASGTSSEAAMRSFAALRTTGGRPDACWRPICYEGGMTDPIDRAPFYHDGMRELQDRFDGRRVADGLEKHRLHFEWWEQDRKLIGEARFFFIATSYRDNVDCSMRSGDPGFVRITGPDTLEYPEYDGNNMYRTLGNIHRNPNVGLLFVRFDGKTFRMRIRGKATIHNDPETLAAHHGAKVVVRVKCEIFPNCPRYVPDLMGDQAAVPPNPFVPATRLRAAGAGMEKPGVSQGRALEVRSASQARRVAEACAHKSGTVRFRG